MTKTELEGIEYFNEHDKENWNYRQFHKFLSKEKIHVEKPLVTWNSNLRYIKSHFKSYDGMKKLIEKIQNKTNKKMKIKPYEMKLKPQQQSKEKGKLNLLSRQPPLDIKIVPSSLPLLLMSSLSLPSAPILLLSPTPPTPSVISSSWSNETYLDALLFGYVKLSNGKTGRKAIFPIYEQADSSFRGHSFYKPFWKELIEAVQH
ncbi:17751_t:CDS:2 [Gigaspora margarita]|uniref:17751_t:CDS:1 n=1 Tax=Gigaspora margarita TaxID=4874 RepID=A0ABM8W126_GIGMA|nr:17751_t:CDS:2 [Gigaspora margarita]